MEYLLEGCQPAAVWHYFEEISAIPRRSGQERAVSEYLCRFAAAHGLEHWRDEWNNVVIKKAWEARAVRHSLPLCFRDIRTGMRKKRRCGPRF